MSDNKNDFESEDFLWDGDDSTVIFASKSETTAVPFLCAACGELNHTQLDLSGGLHQQYTEDCAVCCRPNLLSIRVDEDLLMVTISNELEYD